MKDFCKVLLDIGDAQMIRRLETVMNSEVAFKKEAQSLIGDYKKYPREIDPMLIAQPHFQWAPVGQKLNEIQAYQDLLKE